MTFSPAGSLVVRVNTGCLGVRSGATSSVAVAGSSSANRKVALSRSPSPLGLMVVSRRLSPWNGAPPSPALNREAETRAREAVRAGKGWDQTGNVPSAAPTCRCAVPSAFIATMTFPPPREARELPIDRARGATATTNAPMATKHRAEIFRDIVSCVRCLANPALIPVSPAVSGQQLPPCDCIRSLGVRLATTARARFHDWQQGPLRAYLLVREVTNTQLLVDNTTSIEVAPDRVTALRPRPRPRPRPLATTTWGSSTGTNTQSHRTLSGCTSAASVSSHSRATGRSATLRESVRRQCRNQPKLIYQQLFDLGAAIGR